MHAFHACKSNTMYICEHKWFNLFPDSHTHTHIVDFFLKKKTNKQHISINTFNREKIHLFHYHDIDKCMHVFQRVQPMYLHDQTMSAPPSDIHTYS